MDWRINGTECRSVKTLGLYLRKKKDNVKLLVENGLLWCKAFGHACVHHGAALISDCLL